MLTLAKLKSIPLFASTADEALETLLMHAPARTVSYRRGDLIAMQGTRVRSLLVLLDGAVRAQMTNADGKRLTIDHIDAPDLLAAAFVYSTDNKFPVTVEAMTDATVWSIDREYLLTFMSQHPTLMRQFLGLISDRCAFLSGRIHALSLQNLRERLLGYLATHSILGTQEELAHLLGVTRPALARLLAELLDENILERTATGYQLRR